jgi:polyisoprenoid-binding protein YceI
MTATHAAPTTVQIPRPGRYEIDTQASTVTFKGRHLFGLARVRGTFAIARGEIHVADLIADSSVHAQIDAASFHTGNHHRDNDVRSARFLNADRYPRMTFTSSGLERPGDRPTLAGTLTVRDVARPASLVIEQATLQPASPHSLIVLATTRIDRTEFGLTAAPGLAGRHLDVSLRILAVRR